MAAAIVGMHHLQRMRGSDTTTPSAPGRAAEYVSSTDEGAKDDVDKIALRRRELAKLVVDIGDTFLGDLEAEIRRVPTSYSGWKASKAITYTRNKKSEKVGDGATPDAAYDCDSQYEGLAGAALMPTFFLSLPAVAYKITVTKGDSGTLFSVFVDTSEGHDFGNNAMTRIIQLKWTYNKNSKLEETTVRTLSSTALNFASLLGKAQPQPTLAALICSVNTLSSAVRMRIDRTTASTASFAIFSDVVTAKSRWWGDTVTTRLLEGVLTISKDGAAAISATEHEKDYFASPALSTVQFASVADFLTWWTTTRAASTLNATLQRLASALLDD